MKKEEFIQALRVLSLAYDKEFNQQQTEVWYSFFIKDDYEIFRTAIKNLVATNKYLPSIAEIKQEMANIQTKDIPKAEDEWQEVIRAVHKFGENIPKVREYLKPYTFYIANNIGYINICNSDEERQIWNRKEFIGEYNALKDKEIENIQIGAEERTFLTNNTMLLEEK